MPRMIPVGEATEWNPYEPPPKLTPNQPGFHGDGRYGAPPNPTATAPAPVADALAQAKRNPGLGARAASVLDADVGNVAKRGLKGVTGVARGALGSLTSGLGRVAAPVGLGLTAGQVAGTDTEDYYRRTGIDPVATHVPQLMKDIGVRALGAAQDIGNNATFGLADRLGNGLAGNGFGPSSALSATPVMPKLNLPTANVAPPAPTAPTEPAPVPLTSPDAGLAGNNGFTPQGTVAPNGMNVTPTLDVNTQSELSNAQSDAAGRVDPGAGGGGGAISLGGGGAFGFDDKATRTAEVNAGERNYLLRQGLNSPNKGVRDISMQGIAAGDPTTVQNRATDSAERIASLRDRGETVRANAQNQTNRFIHNDQNNVALRGQDVSLAGHRMSNDVAVANQRREQFNSDRAYSMDVAKYGTEVAEKNRTAGEAAQKATQSQLENQFRTTGADGKDAPDHAKIASYNGAVQQTLPAFIQALQQAGTPEAAAKAKELQTRGHAALGPEDHAQLTQLFNTREQLRGSRSPLPGGAELRDSDNLMNFTQARGAAGVQRNTLTPNRVVFKGGSSATPNDLSLKGGANAILPDFGKVRDDNLLRGIRTE